MKCSSSERVVRLFVDRINAHDVDGLARLMTPRHRFTDSRGVSWNGRKVVRAGWEGYLRWFPDYRVDLAILLSSGDLVAAFGTARGSFEGQPGPARSDRFVQPAAWMAKVTRGRVAKWSVFTDNTVPTRILDRHARKPSDTARKAVRTRVGRGGGTRRPTRPP